MTAKTYWKVPFEWTSTEPPPPDTLPTGWSWSDGDTSPPPINLVADILANSSGPEDRRAVEAVGAAEAARRILARAPGFTYLPGRWQLLSAAGDPAGFVLPAIFDGCARDGLDEATIYHIGVSPLHRGAGIGRLLLRRATRLLATHGVWRIACDTPTNNTPMIHLFESENWSRFPEHERTIGSP